ncbi:hypothetical protein ACFFRR_010581 [Megaselia abdita]
MANEQYNEDELIAPEWMNKDFFEKILRVEDDSIEIQDLITKPGSSKGDHYGSVMYRSIVTYNTKTEKNVEKSFIIKTVPFVEGVKKDMFEGTDMFDIEIKMYNEVLPKFEKMLKSVNDDTQLWGKCVHAAFKPHKVLIFEDLRTKNYKPVDNWGGSWEVCKKSVEKLAKWHAMSYKMVNDGDRSLQEFTNNVFTNDKMYESPNFANGFKNFLEMLEKKPEFQKYVAKFKKLLAENPISKNKATYKAFSNGDKANLFVLNHGDFHIKNVMFTEKDDGKIDEVLLLDFQLCIWGPAVIDLVYMLYMMLDSESRIHRRNEMIHFYFEKFTEALQKLGFTGNYPKLTDLYKDFITYKDMELFLLTTMLPFLIGMKEDLATADDVEQMIQGACMNSLYENKCYLDHIRIVLPNLLHKGYLD